MKYSFISHVTTALLITSTHKQFGAPGNPIFAKESAASELKLHRQL